MPKLISFVQQKGGTGKTTLTMLTANYFHDAGAKVIILDSDFPQHSFARVRRMDMHNLSNEDPQHRTGEEILQQQGKTPYPVHVATVSESSIQLRVLKTFGETQFIFCDMPGMLNVAGIPSVFRSLDYIIIPCELEQKSIIAALETMDVIRQCNAAIPVGFVWTKIKKNHRVAERMAYEDYINENFKVHVFKFILFDTVRVSQQLNTLHSQSDTIHEFIEELTEFFTGPLAH